MQAACLTCGLGLTICLFKITSNTQGTTSFTLAPGGGGAGRGERNDKQQLK